MALARDLLDQADHLAALDTRRPKQANLRRAVSSAYYALFHLLTDEGSRLLPATPLGLQARVTRAFAHEEMKQVCVSISGIPSAALHSLQPHGFSPQLKTVCKAFYELQEARHKADYDISLPYARIDVLALLRQTRNAFDAWALVRGTDEARVFLIALLLSKKWSR